MTLNQFCVEALRRRLGGKQRRLAAEWPPLRFILESRFGPELDGVALFGSAAREEATASSDIDLLLCLTRESELTRDLYSAWDELADGHPDIIPASLSPHFVRTPDSPESAGSLWLEVAIDGIVLWERALELSRFLASVRRHLLSGRVVRKSSYGVPYWVRNDAESATR